MRIKHSAKKINQMTIQSDSKLNNSQFWTNNNKYNKFNLSLPINDQQYKEEQFECMINKKVQLKNQNQQINGFAQNGFTQNCQSPTISQKDYQKAINNYKTYFKKLKSTTQKPQTQENVQSFKKIKTQSFNLNSFNPNQRLTQSIQIINKCKRKASKIKIITQFKNNPSVQKTLTQLQNLKNLETSLQNKQFQLLSIQQYFKRKNNKTQLSRKSENLNQPSQIYGLSFRPKISKQAKKWYSAQKRHIKTQQNNDTFINLSNKSQINSSTSKNFFRSKSLIIHLNNTNQNFSFLKDKQQIQVKNQKKKTKSFSFKKVKSYQIKKKENKEELNFQQQKLILKPKQNKVFQYPWNWIKYQFSLNLHAKQWK